LIIQPGDVCQITLETKNGSKQVKGILIDQNETQQLWLLVYFIHPELPQENTPITMIGRSFSRLLGYSDCQAGNVRLLDGDTPAFIIGTISDHAWSRLCCEIYTSHESWKLERIRTNRPSGITFWINLNPPVGSTIPGMRRGREREVMPDVVDSAL
jgi:hypothetical protein